MRKIGLLIALAFCASIATISAAISAPNWTVYSNVQYGLTSEETADLFLLNRGVNPVVVFIHGGGWQAGDKSYVGDYARLYGLAGFHVIAINYRLASYSDPGKQWNAQLQDTQLFIRWLRQVAAIIRVDPTRIGVAGESAGGHLALFLGSLNTSVSPAPGVSGRSNYYASQSPKASAVLDMFGPTDLTRPEMYASLGSLALFGARTYAQAPSLYRDASPLFRVNSQTAPTCVVQGMYDTTVPPSQSIALINALYARGAPYKWLPFNGGHGFSGLSPLQRADIDNRALQCMIGYLHPNPLNAW
ncbi:alpha/beta hydrolase fold domain-containing protein [Methylocystis echinoides]|uniref:Lipase n=1 Tax=Methylocystis echinoides TaxID=29468 RepID=A0A9W6GY20_9HYPH|nr:alpha/beta hydrolase fold domain-containing protein [Methylocystis echinoides]GLI94960.1 lipase [Methylocystis echinoides]